MDRAPFNRLAMASTCRKCGRAICEHSDPVYAGIIPEISPAAPADSSRAVQHRAGLYSSAATEAER